MRALRVSTFGGVGGKGCDERTVAGERVGGFVACSGEVGFVGGDALLSLRSGAVYFLQNTLRVRTVCIAFITHLEITVGCTSPGR
jgi:hypothetical protein